MASAKDPKPATHPVWPLVLVLCGLLIGAVLFAPPVVVAERARIEANTLAATPRIVGRIARLNVEEGARVKAGQVLAILEAGELADEVARAEAALAAAEAGQPAAAVAAALQDVQRRAATDQAAAALVAAKADLTAAQARAAQAESTLAATTAGQARGVVGEQERITAEADTRAARAAVQAAHGRLNAAETALTLARRQAGLGTVERTGVARSAADVRQARALLAIARRHLAQTAIVAPADGIVARRLSAIGDQVQPGQPVYTVLAHGTLWVRAEVRQADAPALRPGAHAEVIVDALPDRTWNGTVSRLGVVAEPIDATVGRLAPAVALIITLDPHEQTDTQAGLLLPGMTARASIARTGPAGWWRTWLAGRGS